MAFSLRLVLLVSNRIDPFEEAEQFDEDGRLPFTPTLLKLNFRSMPLLMRDTHAPGEGISVAIPLSPPCQILVKRFMPANAGPD